MNMQSREIIEAANILARLGRECKGSSDTIYELIEANFELSHSKLVNTHMCDFVGKYTLRQAYKVQNYLHAEGFINMDVGDLFMSAYKIVAKNVRRCSELCYPDCDVLFDFKDAYSYTPWGYRSEKNQERVRGIFSRGWTSGIPFFGSLCNCYGRYGTTKKDLLETNWDDFNHADGVYVLINDGFPIYVGQSSSAGKRIRTHLRNGRQFEGFLVFDTEQILSSTAEVKTESQNENTIQAIQNYLEDFFIFSCLPLDNISISENNRISINGAEEKINIQFLCDNTKTEDKGGCE